MQSNARVVRAMGPEVRGSREACLSEKAFRVLQETESSHGAFERIESTRRFVCSEGRDQMQAVEARSAIASPAEGSLTDGRDAIASSKRGGCTEVSPEKLLDDVRSTMAADPASARSAALRLVMLLSARPTAGATIARGGLAPWQLRRLDRYLSENLANSLRLPALAEEVNLSVSHFNRSFKASRGLTPHLYIVKLRLELAQSLMLTTSDPLCAIALTCGLADQAHLTKLFRRHFGDTPAAWRRRRANGGPRPARGRDITDHLIRSVPGAQSRTFAPHDRKQGRGRNSTVDGVAIHWATAGPFPVGPPPMLDNRVPSSRGQTAG